MSFVSQINFCLEKDIEDNYTIVVTDITDVYDATDNPTGWEDATTLEAANLTEATIQITYTDSSLNVITTTTDILNQIPDPVTGQIEFDSFVFSGDGLYKIVYTLKTAGSTFTACKQKMLYPEVACCISNKIKKLASNLDNSTLKDQVLKLKAFEAVLKNSCSTVDDTTALNVLNSLEKLCEADCGCGC